MSYVPGQVFKDEAMDIELRIDAFCGCGAEIVDGRMRLKEWRAYFQSEESITDRALGRKRVRFRNARLTMTFRL